MVPSMEQVPFGIGSFRSEIKLEVLMLSVSKNVSVACIGCLIGVILSILAILLKVSA